jgi:hypothetical protein
MLNGSPLWRVYTTEQRALPYVTAHFDFANQIRLLGYDLTSTTVTPGQAVGIRPYWQQLAHMPSNYSLFIHLYPADRIELLAQNDGFPSAVGIGWPTSQWNDYTEPVVGPYREITIPTNLPPGPYRLVLGLYDYVNGHRLIGAEGQDFWSIPINVDPA